MSRPREAYEERYSGVLGYYFKRIEEITALPKNAALGRTVLDLGAGTGRLAKRLSSTGATVLECDVSLGRLRIAMRRCGNIQNVFVICGDGQNLPIADGCFSGVVCLGTFEYAKDIQPFMKEVHRVSKPGAVIILTLWNKDRWDRGIKLFRLEEAASQFRGSEVQAILKELGFSWEKCRTVAFMPRRLFWWAYTHLPGSILKSAWVVVSLGIELLLMQASYMKGAGSTLIIEARRV